MRSNIRNTVLAVAFTTAFAATLLARQDAHGESMCESEELFGICDPFVPGVRIRTLGDMKPILVHSTWPDGPADKAGICAGDQIVAVNEVSALENESDRMTREIVSDAPGPVVLKIRRGADDLEFKVSRVRESALANLSKQKYLRSYSSDRKQHTPLVPLDETREEVDALENIQKRFDAHTGYTRIEGVPVPIGTPREQFKALVGLTSGLPPSERIGGWVGLPEGPEGYCTGFRALVLKGPSEVVVYLVLPQSPAHRAGVLPGDEVLEVDGHAVSSLKPTELGEMLVTPDRSRQITVTLRRRGSTRRLALVTEGLSDIDARNPLVMLPDRWGRGYPSSLDYILGMNVLYAENLGEAVVESLDYPSPAFAAGLHLGDLLLRIDGVPIGKIGRLHLNKILLPSQASGMTLEASRLGRKLNFRLKPITYEEALASIGRKMTKLGPTPQHCP